MLQKPVLASATSSRPSSSSRQSWSEADRNLLGECREGGKGANDPFYLLTALLGKSIQRDTAEAGQNVRRNPSDLSHPSNSSLLTRAASKESKQSELKPPVPSNQLRSSCLSTAGDCSLYIPSRVLCVSPVTAACPTQGTLLCLNVFRPCFGDTCASITTTRSHTTTYG